MAGCEMLRMYGCSLSLNIRGFSPQRANTRSYQYGYAPLNATRRVGLVCSPLRSSIVENTVVATGKDGAEMET